MPPRRPRSKPLRRLTRGLALQIAAGTIGGLALVGGVTALVVGGSDTDGGDDAKREPAAQAEAPRKAPEKGPAKSGHHAPRKGPEGGASADDDRPPRTHEDGERPGSSFHHRGRLATWMDEGTFLVGEAVEPGTYVSQGVRPGAPVCFWGRYPSGRYGHFIDNAVVRHGPARVTVHAGEDFKTNGCKTWKKRH